MTRSEKTLGIYIHVPFCASKCPYCDFYSHCDRALIPDYADAVCGELLSLRRTAAAADCADAKTRETVSVYFGGGTPSLLPPEQLSRILDTVRRAYRLTPDAEITLECNPGLDAPEAYFSAAAGAGVNRVSLGMQSAVDAERRRLGRRSGREAVSRCVDAARAAGIGNLSLDVMAGIPGQTLESLRETLDFALARDVPHLSVYLLKLEPGTVFYQRRDSLGLPDEDETAEMYLFLSRYLRAHGYRHYEISNFCKNGLPGKHNLRYWQGGEYLGIGPGAHGFLNGARYCQPPDLRSFLDGAPCELTDTGGGAAETLMLALRTDEGLDPQAFCARFGLKPDGRFEAKTALLRREGLLAGDTRRLCLTDRGMLLSNAVILALADALALTF